MSVNDAPFYFGLGLYSGPDRPKIYFGFPGTFHRTVLSYYGRQVSEACYLTVIYGVKDSLVRAIIAED